MSQNMIVNCRRSGADAEAAVARATLLGCSASFEARAAPQLGQNFAPGGLAWPQLAQERGNGVPHAWQNLAASGTTAVQFGHSTLAPNTHELCKLSRQCCPKNLERWLINLSASAFGQLARGTQ